MRFITFNDEQLVPCLLLLLFHTIKTPMFTKTIEPHHFYKTQGHRQRGPAVSGRSPYNFLSNAIVLSHPPTNSNGTTELSFSLYL